LLGGTGEVLVRAHSLRKHRGCDDRQVVGISICNVNREDSKMNMQVVMAAVAVLAVTVTVSADPIFVENWSFEQPGVGKPGFPEIPGWTGEGSGGGGAETGWDPTDGSYTGFCGGNMEVFQLTGHTIVANAEYTLTIDARRTWEGPNITLELYYDDAGARVPMGSLFHEFVGGSTTDMEELTLTVASNDSPQSIGKKIGIRFKSGPPDAAWIGFDSVRLDYVVLGPIVNASDPSPSDAATDVCRDTTLTWMPGEFAVAHDVYLGTDFDDVNDAATTADPHGVYRGQVSVAQFDISTVVIPEYGQTYYWRIDEIDGPPANTRHKGDVWSFTIEPESRPVDGAMITATASSTGAMGGGPETTIDGSGLDEDDLHSTAAGDMWLSADGGAQPTWIQYDLGRVYDLAQAFVWNYNGFGLNSTFGMKEVTVEYSIDGVAWTELQGIADLAKAPGAAGYDANSTIDFGGMEAQHVRITAVSNYIGLQQYGLSEIRFSYIPYGARAFSPADGTNDVDPEADLNWIPGRGVTTHNVYLSTNRDLVADRTALATSIPVGDTCQQAYDPGLLQLGETYHWTVDEVSAGGTAMGQVLKFTVLGSLVIDDMEDYGDAVTPGEPGGRPWYVWKDGAGWETPSAVPGNGTGSTIGNAIPPYPEENTVYEGNRSLPYVYNNTGAGGKAVYSEATANVADLPIGTNWSGVGGKMIRVWFYGNSTNSVGANDRMYIKLNGVKVPYDGDPADLQDASWQAWDIDLALFTGMDLTNVTQVSLGFGDDNGIAGGSGTVYFDGITLYPSICILSERSAELARVDFVPDCVIDHRELEAMSEDWLLTTLTPPSDAFLVGWWKLDDGAGVTAADSSAHGNNGTLNGDPQWVTGKTNGALEFDGNDYVEVPHTDILTVDSEVTVMAWINAQRHDSDGGDWQGILAKSNAPRSYSFYTYVDGTLHFSTTSGGGYVGSNSTGQVPLNEWVHVCAMVVGGMHRYYINGVLAGEAHSGIVLPGTADTDPVRIGMTQEGNNGFLGMIDDVRIYNRAVTREEILSLIGSPIDLNEDKVIDFKDYAVLADQWLDERLWP